MSKNFSCALCTQKIFHIYYCSKCSSYLCSESCLISHFNSNHNSSSKLLSPLTSPKKSNLTSPFFTNGTILNLAPVYITKTQFEEYEKVKTSPNFLLGSGSYGDVYLVRHKPTNQFYALKEMNKNRIISRHGDCSIIEKEIELHSKIYHSNIIHLVSAYEDADYFYMLWEYISEGSWYNSIKKGKIYSEEQIVRYFTQIASAISFLHDNNWIHRDIKPENIWINDKDEIKLCDFGCCSEMTIGNRNTFCGTLEYMAPEIIKENSYNKSVDAWSLGILLYELYYGYTPFNMKYNGGKTQEMVMKDIINSNIDFKKSNVFISDEGRDLIKKLLVYRAAKRYKVKDIFKDKFVEKFGKDEEKLKWDSSKKDYTETNRIKYIKGLDCNSLKRDKTFRKWGIEETYQADKNVLNKSKNRLKLRKKSDKSLELYSNKLIEISSNDISISINNNTNQKTPRKTKEKITISNMHLNQKRDQMNEVLIHKYLHSKKQSSWTNNSISIENNNTSKLKEAIRKINTVQEPQTMISNLNRENNGLTMKNSERSTYNSYNNRKTKMVKITKSKNFKGAIVPSNLVDAINLLHSAEKFVKENHVISG